MLKIWQNDTLPRHTGLMMSWMFLMALSAVHGLRESSPVKYYSLEDQRTANSHNFLVAEAEARRTGRELEDLRNLERLMEMEVRAVDSLRTAERAKRADHALDWEHDLVGTAEGDVRSFEHLATQALDDTESSGSEQTEDSDVDLSEFEMHCSDIGTIADGTPEGEEKACSFVREQCTPKGGLINYLELPYCAMNTSPTWVSALFLLAWVFILFIWLSAMVDFLVPSLTAISNYCNFRESVAGVTFLALGNGSSDIFSMTAATLSGIDGMDLAIGEVLGNGMFLFCGVQAIIAFIAPFQANRAEYIRDCGFYSVAILMMFFVLADGQVSLLEGCLFLFIYAIYILVVVRFELILRVFGQDPKDFDLHEDDSGVPGNEEEYTGLTDGADPTLSEYMTPVKQETLEGMPWWERAVTLVKTPAIVLLKLTVPVVDMKEPLNGWCRPALCLQLFLFPGLVAVFVVRRVLPADMMLAPPAMALVFGALLFGGFVAVAVWYNSQDAAPPPFHRALSFVGFVAAVLWIYITAEEIVNVILAFGVIFELGKVSLGITILAIGIGFQDLVSDIGVARAGYPTMAATACVGSPMLNFLLGIGFSAIFGNVFVASPLPLRLTVQLVVCLVFLLASVAVCLVFMVWNGFRGDFSLGVLLMSCYVVFMGFAVAADVTQSAYGIRYLN